MPKAYSYIRFSTTEQNKGDSLRRQISLSEDFAKVNNLTIDDSINLHDLGISAFDKSNITKGALGKFLDLVNKGKIEKGSFLLVESLDRLSRAEVLDALSIFLNILNAGITIVTLIDNITYSRENLKDNYQNLLLSIFIMSRASEESLTKSHRIRASWDNKRKIIGIKRFTARCPYWLKPTNEDNGFEFINERVEVVRRILSMAKNGMGNSTITKVLNHEQVKPFSKKSDGWQPSYIQKILKSPALYGDFQLKMIREMKELNIGEVINNYYPAVISKDEWLLLNSRREQRISRGGAFRGKTLSNLFSGILVCGHCKGPISMGAHKTIVINEKPVTRKYVSCSRARRGLGCKHLTWNYKELETEILSFCKSIDFLEIIGKPNQQSVQAEVIHKRRLSLNDSLKTNENKITNLLDAIEQASGSHSLAARIKSLEDENNTLREEIRSLKDLEEAQIIESKEVESQKEALEETILQLGKLEQNELLEIRHKLAAQIKRLIKEIHLYPGGEWITNEKSEKLKEDLIKIGSEKNIIDNYLKALEKPNKENRYILIMFNNGEFLNINRKNISHNFNKFNREEYADKTNNEMLLLINKNKSKLNIN